MSLSYVTFLLLQRLFFPGFLYITYYRILQSETKGPHHVHSLRSSCSSVPCKLSQRICNGKFSWFANPNTYTIWLFNSLVMGLLVGVEVDDVQYKSEAVSVKRAKSCGRIQSLGLVHLSSIGLARIPHPYDSQHNARN